MNDPHTDDGSKKAKNIAAIVYLLVLSFLVGGSYWHQQQEETAGDAAKTIQP